MNYGELKSQVIIWSHRTDLEGRVPEFIANAGQRIGRRLGVMPSPLILDTDTNSILKVHSQIYLFGSLREMMIYTENAPAVQAYELLYQEEVRNININYRGLDWDACEGPVISTPTQRAKCPD